MKKICFSLLFLGGFACQSESPDTTLTEQKGVQIIDKAACEAQNGQVIRSMLGEICSLPSKDAGKVCTSSGGCEGLCLADDNGNGACSAQQKIFGCIPVLENGERVTICID